MDNLKTERPTRKRNRLENHDYSACGAYFITICTAKRENHFWEHSKSFADCPQSVTLSKHGKIVEKAISNISSVYPALTVDHYVIMPDHIHLLVRIRSDDHGEPMVAPTISRVVQQLKGYVTKHIGFPIWQKLFFDHIIRNRQDYEEHAKYIYDNPMKYNGQPL